MSKTPRTDYAFRWDSELKDYVEEPRYHMAKLERELAEAAELLRCAICPDCDGSGAYPVDDGRGGRNAAQCRWCFERNLALAKQKENEMDNPLIYTKKELRNLLGINQKLREELNEASDAMKRIVNTNRYSSTVDADAKTSIAKGWLAKHKGEGE